MEVPRCFQSDCGPKGFADRAEYLARFLLAHSLDEIPDKLDILSLSGENRFESPVGGCVNAVGAILGSVDDLNVFHNMTVGLGSR